MNAQTVRDLFADFGRGDFESALAKVREDVDWGEPPDMPDTGGGYHGHEGLVKSFARFMGAWQELRVDIVELVEVGDRVAVMTHWAGRSKGTGIEVDQRVAQVYEFRGGKVARVRQFRGLEEALAAARD